jgi:ABC-type sugar transport system ATPase subunit
MPPEVTVRASLSDQVGTVATLAVRPQYLEWSYEPWPDFNLEVVVDVVEPVGTEEIVHCRFGDTELQGLFPLFGGLREGERAYLHFGLENALIFNGTDDEARRLL